MKRLFPLILLAAPADASTVDFTQVALDAGDRGLIMTAEGFRPVDGIDDYPGKINPTIYATLEQISCSARYDAFVPAKRPHWIGPFWNCSGQTPGEVFAAFADAVTPDITTQPPATRGIVIVDPPTLDWRPLPSWFDCCSQTFPITPTEAQTIPTTPTPSSGWLMLSALFLFLILKRVTAE